MWLYSLHMMINENNNDSVEKVISDNKQDAIVTEKKEINGPKGLEPTRYGDWEKAGRCIDF